MVRIHKADRRESEKWGAWADLEEVVSEVGPEQVEAGHLDGDEEDRVDRCLQGGARPCIQNN